LLSGVPCSHHVANFGRSREWPGRAAGHGLLTALGISHLENGSVFAPRVQYGREGPVPPDCSLQDQPPGSRGPGHCLGLRFGPWFPVRPAGAVPQNYLNSSSPVMNGCQRAVQLLGYLAERITIAAQGSGPVFYFGWRGAVLGVFSGLHGGGYSLSVKRRMRGGGGCSVH